MPYKNLEKQKKAQRNHYLKNKEKYNSSTLKRRVERAKWWDSYKNEMKFACVRCGESHPACIAFHHINPDEKNMGISDLVTFAYPIEIILEEIKKCEVMCHNCHYKFHWENDLRRRNF